MFRVALAVLACLVATPSWSLSSQYISIADQVVGFAYEAASKAWHADVFRNGDKYILRQLNADERQTWGFLSRDRQPKPTMGFFEMGDSTLFAVCYVDSVPGEPAILCHSLVGEVTFGEDLPRFEITFTGGHLWDAKLGTMPDTPAITIGTCSSF